MKKIIHCLLLISIGFTIVAYAAGPYSFRLSSYGQSSTTVTLVQGNKNDFTNGLPTSLNNNIFDGSYVGNSSAIIQLKNSRDQSCGFKFEVKDNAGNKAFVVTNIDRQAGSRPGYFDCSGTGYNNAYMFTSG